MFSSGTMVNLPSHSDIGLSEDCLGPEHGRKAFVLGKASAQLVVVARAFSGLDVTMFHLLRRYEIT